MAGSRRQIDFAVAYLTVLYSRNIRSLMSILLQGGILISLGISGPAWDLTDDHFRGHRRGSPPVAL